MQVGAVSTIIPLTADKQTVPQSGHPADTVLAAKAAAAKPEATVPKEPYKPAPPIHPTVQDTIDINRSLLLLRQM